MCRTPWAGTCRSATRSRRRASSRGRPSLIVSPLVRVMVGPYNEPPFRVDAIAVEDDTYNVLSANPEFQATPATIGEAMAGLEHVGPHPVGSVVVKPGRPLIFQAIVHDLSRDPSCSEGSVRGAL